MKKRVLALFLCLIMTFCMVCPSAFADVEGDLMPNHTHDWKPCSIGGFTGEIQGITVGVEVTQCSDCGWYKHTCNFFGYKLNYYSIVGFTNMGGELATWVANNVYNILGKNASAKKYETGGGSAGTGGVGRRPSGYADDNGVPSVGSTGKLQIVVNPSFRKTGVGWTESGTTGSLIFDSRGYIDYSPTKLFFNFTSAIQTSFDVKYEFIAPIDGLYTLDSQVLIENYYTWKDERLKSYKGNASKNVTKGSTCNLLSSSISFQAGYESYYNVPLSYTAIVHPAVVTVVPSSTTINNYNKITINNNTWNGNIYQDNSTNLTYIYPQYTTINENNETVTNISENPIIYNSETKQYYTYDTVTNNYYYIYYNSDSTPTPTPEPDPTPTPDPGTSPTPTPGTDPTPTPRPSTPESGESGGSSGSSWWDKLLNKIGDAIVDGLLGAISAVLKLIFKLFTTILGWIIWLVSQVLTLFPFLPPGLGALLIGGVVVCFIIGLIKFIRG